MITCRVLSAEHEYNDYIMEKAQKTMKNGKLLPL